MARTCAPKTAAFAALSPFRSTRTRSTSVRDSSVQARSNRPISTLRSTRSARTTGYQTLVSTKTSMSGWRVGSVLGAGVDKSVNRRPDAVCAGTSGGLQLQDIRDADNAVPAAGLALSCQSTAGDQLVHELT